MGGDKSAASFEVGDDGDARAAVEIVDARAISARWQSQASAIRSLSSRRSAATPAMTLIAVLVMILDGVTLFRKIP